ncbi:cdc42 effector protein 1-like [Callorhinchus milii]|uniref:cdc42 effector protein 1-like n=1 Tax=Callorhinchus milii TaxID=7868 RepID=UPI001C3F61E8|nr:cdc42 effector protein 1-like [Callorhinchus milii]
MSLGKFPVLKNLVSGSHGKRRARPELTVDMISPPLGDFRHTMHVGRGGDVFGDTSFLSQHGGGGRGGEGGGQRVGGKASLLARAMRSVAKSPARPREHSPPRPPAPPPPVSPIIKNAVSLPHLANTHTCTQERLNFRSAPTGLGEPYGLQSGFCTLPRYSRAEKPQEQPPLPRPDSLLTFDLDLGPSMLSEVLEAMTWGEAPKGRAQFSLEGPLRETAEAEAEAGGTFQNGPGGRQRNSEVTPGGNSLRTDLKGPVSAGTNSSPVHRILSRHFVPSRPPAKACPEEAAPPSSAGPGGQGSLVPTPPPGVRAPADGADSRALAGGGERPEHGHTPPGALPPHGFHPLKIEELVFADEDEVIGV